MVNPSHMKEIRVYKDRLSGGDWFSAREAKDEGYALWAVCGDALHLCPGKVPGQYRTGRVDVG